MGPVEGLLTGGKTVPSAAVLNFTPVVADPDGPGSFAREIMNVQFLQSDLPWGEDDAELGAGGAHAPTRHETAAAQEEAAEAEKAKVDETVGDGRPV